MPTNPSGQSSQATQGSQATLVLNLDVDRYEFNTPASLCLAPLVTEAVAGSFGQSHWNTANKAQPSLLSKALPSCYPQCGAPLAGRSHPGRQLLSIQTPGVVRIVQDRPLLTHSPPLSG